MLHTVCYNQMLNKEQFKCPICKRFMPIDDERD